MPIVGALIVGLALVTSAILVSVAFKHSREGDDTIRVNGTARRIVHSDYIIWDADVSYQATTVSEAYSALQGGTSKLTEYIASKGVKADEIFPLAIQTSVLYEKAQNNDNGMDESIYRTVKGYRLSQTIEVRSNDVKAVEAVSRTATELIKQGVSLVSHAPQYRITNLAELKDSILAEAASNARVRAQQIAKSSGQSLGPLSYSHMGLMSVTGAYDDEQSGGGEDTQSIDKRVTVMVTSAYRIR
jgi:hypothetical protein